MSVSPALAGREPPASAQPGMSASRRAAGFGTAGLRLGRRLAGSLAVILCVLTVTFLVTRVFAPDPASLFLGSASNGFVSPQAQAQARAKVRADLGLDRPLLAQYTSFLGQIARGDLGVSFQTGRSVSSDLRTRLPATAELALYSLLLGVTVGVLAGVASAVRRERFTDRATRFVTVGFLAMPQFWIGLMLLWIFYTKLHIAPGPVGRLPLGTPAPDHITGFYLVDATLTGNWSAASAAFKQLALPVITLGLGLAAPICKVVRSSMIEALTSDYVRTATALGFGRRRIWLAYALKNAMLPLVTILAGIVAYTLSGSILVEGIFGWPGVGNYSLQAIQTSDFPAIQGFVVYSAVLYVVLYEVLNSVYAIVDPRAKA